MNRAHRNRTLSPPRREISAESIVRSRIRTRNFKLFVRAVFPAVSRRAWMAGNFQIIEVARSLFQEAGCRYLGCGIPGSTNTIPTHANRFSKRNSRRRAGIPSRLLPAAKQPSGLASRKTVSSPPRSDSSPRSPSARIPAGNVRHGHNAQAHGLPNSSGRL